MAKKYSIFLASYKIFNIIKSIFLSLYNIIKYYNIEKFLYNDYLAIFTFKLLLSIIMIDNSLDKNKEIFS